jgi:NAD-dependent dihydropyrimidine dehydrogenase PreA subunit
MAFVIAEPCIGTKDTACVDVCPVDCIHTAKIAIITVGQSDKEQETSIKCRSSI